MHAGGYYGTRWARNNNVKLRSTTPLTERTATYPADARLFAETLDYLSSPCGVRHLRACPNASEESPAILKLKITSEVPAVKRLISTRAYSTGYSLLEDLARLHEARGCCFPTCPGRIPPNSCRYWCFCWDRPLSNSPL